MKSAEEVLNDFPLLKSYKGYSALVACLEMKMSTLNAKVFLIFSLSAIRTINNAIYCAFFT